MTSWIITCPATPDAALQHDLTTHGAQPITTTRPGRVWRLDTDDHALLARLTTHGARVHPNRPMRLATGGPA